MPLALVASAPDRPGLAHEVGEAVRALGGNIETSRMVALGQEFVVAALITLPDDEAATAAELEANLAGAGFAVQLKPTGRPTAEGRALPYTLTAVTLDHPGVVERVAQRIRGVGGNIIDGETYVVPAPWSGAPTFTFRARLMLPDAAAARALREELADLAAEENLDIGLEAVAAGA